MSEIHDNPTSYQKLIANKLDVDISKTTLNVAGAKIYDVVQKAINPDAEIRNATVQQINFGKKLGLNLKSDSMRVASAKIDDKLKEKNINALENLKLKSGDKVKKKNKISVDGEEKILITKHIVSSIGKNHRVYFKGGNGQGAWPTQLERLNNS